MFTIKTTFDKYQSISTIGGLIIGTSLYYRYVFKGASIQIIIEIVQ